MASSSSPNWTHDVYLSFHGVDLRKGFLNQMQKRLRSKGVDLFIDEEVVRGSSIGIGPELIEAIRGSRIAIVMLSRNYASSSRCLDELVEIMKCKEELGQVVIPVLYEMSPGDEQKPTQDLGKTEEDVMRWEKALGQVATIAAYHSRSWDNEASLIEDLAVHILSILEKTSLSSGIQGLHSDEDVQPKKKTRKDGDEADTVEETTSASDASAMLRNSSERAFKGISSNGLEHTVCIYCADTLQYSFASHLSVGFHRKGISASVNCNGTLDVIEEASASVVVISKTYLSSPSCLDKLVKVLQLVQLVVPVFYGISPSDVAVEKEQESADRVKDWSSALQELRELPGTHSREESSECELVEEIVKDVYEKLFPMEQIGINSRLLEIRQMLCRQPWGIRRIGIWGMPGIGKTTLAKATFDQIAGGYEASCFIKHFDKAFHEKGLYRLLDEHFGKILKEIPRVCSSITRPSLPGEKISKKRTLVVLDDVRNPLVAESFLGRFHWFGPGSLIIITSRDKQVFRLCQIDHVYEVQSLNKNEALQLFSQCAFGEDIREQNLLELSMEVIDYANGNPFALSFYGGALKGKELSEMETTLLNFRLRAPYKIHDLFKSSYESLNDNEKDIFLDIACFFKGEDVDYVMQLLEECGLFPHVGIDVLVEKCLVTISENRVEMHRIIQDFGREIINGETVQIERRRRLWEPWTVKFLLEDDKLEANEYPKPTCKRALGTEDIEGIFLDTSNLLFDVKPTAFENMLNLRFLKIYCSSHVNHCELCLPRGLESLPYELRLLHWENYPLHSLPQDFEPSHLVELNMSYSQLQMLWGGTKNLDMLKMVRLCHSQQLTEIGDICKAQNIELIDLKGCIKLQSFPATDHLQHLRVVNLSGCREIKSFSEVSPNIEELDLQGTSIRELPISIGNATSLRKLCLARCECLVKLPFSMGNATNLKILDLSGCSSLIELPSSIGNATNLEILNLEYCSSLVELPSSIENTTNLEKLCLTGCSSLVELPSFIKNATKLMVDLPSSMGNTTNIKELNFIGCSSLEEISCITNSTSLISMDLDEDNSLPVVTISDNSGSRCIEVRRAKRGKLYVLRGEQNDEHHVSFTFILRDENEITLSSCFPFYQESDNASKVSREVVELLESTDLDVTFLAELIDILLVNLIPTWKTDVTVDHLIPWQSPLNPNSRSQQNEAKTQKDWTWSRSPPPPPQQPPSPASTTTTRSHENSSTLHMLIPNPSHYQVYANAMSMHQLPHQHNQQPTWQSPSSSDHHHNSQTEIGTVHVENSGKGLSLSRSSSLQAAEKAEEYRNIYYGSNSSNAPSHHQYNQLKTPFADFSQHHQLPNQFRSSPAASTSSIGATNILRNSRYTKAAQELWEEVCSVGREFTKKAKTRNSLNPNTSGGSGGGGGSPSSARAIKDHPPLSASDRIEHQRRKVKLLSMLDEVYRRYNDYCEHLQVVVNSLDIVMGPGAALPYTALAQKSMSRHFRCLKDAVAAQLRQSCELLDKDGAGISSSGLTKGETPRLRLVEQSLRLQRAFNQMVTMEQEAWRPQRGLHERSVSILRAWLFEHFLHPYPSDADKHLLARQTGLSRNQVSNWFINARVRLWKPMVEEMYQSAADADTAVETGQGLGSPDIDAYENDPSSLLLPASSYSKAASV